MLRIVVNSPTFNIVIEYLFWSPSLTYALSRNMPGYPWLSNVTYWLFHALVINCTQPQEMEEVDASSANFNRVNGSFFYMSSVTYTCSLPLRFWDGTVEKTIHCTESSVWSEENLRCQGKDIHRKTKYLPSLRTNACISSRRFCVFCRQQSI